MQFRILNSEKDREWIMKKHTIAIVLAAGQGKRMNSKVPKQYLLIREKPILYYTLKTFEDSFIDEIVLVVGEGEEEYCQRNFVEAYNFTKISAIVTGGKERYHSVYQALNYINCEDQRDTLVFIHDGARPFVSEEVLHRVYDVTEKTGACIVGVPVKDTIKVIGKDGIVNHTPDRETLWSIQTPQVFSYTKIKKAYDKMLELEHMGQLDKNITDDAMVMEIYGELPVCVAEGSYENIKITTPDDLILAERILLKQ